MADRDQLTEENRLLKQQKANLEAEVNQLRRMIYGAKRERFIPVDDQQLSVFDDEDFVPVDEDKEHVSYERRKPKSDKKAKRLLLPAELPRQEEVIIPEEVDPDKAEHIGDKVTEVLEYEPARFYVRRIVRPVFKLSETQLSYAELPALPIPSGNAGASVLASLLVSKFIDHQPFYRQVQSFKRSGIKIAESTITGWFRKSCELLEPLYAVLQEQVKASDYLQADETPIPVQSSNKPGSTQKGYHWVYHAPKTGLVLFDYCKSRGREGPEELLKDFQGCLQTDGYAAYEQIGKRAGITHLVCMAHIRRKFEQALDNDQALATYFLEQVQTLYALEREATEQGLSPEARQKLRQARALPIMQTLKGWLTERAAEVLPKSGLGKAVGYALRHWEQMMHYAEGGHWQIDNNLVENKIRPVALGRKNYLFAGSHEAAQQAAMIYSFFGTCKAHEVEPYQWLKQTLESIPEYPVNQLQELLPIKK